MIKTVSFAPPRAASGAAKPSSKVAARSAAVQNAKARAKANAPLAPAQPAVVALASETGTILGASSVTSLFPTPSAPAEVSAAKARDQLQGASAPKSRSRSSASAPQSIVASTSARRSPRRVAPPELSLDLFPVDPAPVEPMPVVEAEPKAKAGRETTANVKSELQHEVEAAENAAPQAVAPQAVAPQAAPITVPAKRAKRAKVPVNLAEQYGQSLSKRVEGGVELPVAEEEAPKKRLNRAERAARRELMNPDDDLRARLQRAQNAVPLARPEKRPRGWRFDCGRCGRTSYFETPGALCSCGALAMKE